MVMDLMPAPVPRADRPPELLAMPVSLAGFTPFALRELRKADLRTIGDIANMTRLQFEAKIPNGWVQLHVLATLFGVHRLRLGDGTYMSEVLDLSTR